MPTKPAPPQTTWAYSYQIVPPQSKGRLRTIQALLDQERADAEREGRTWKGRFVLDQRITHILVLSDSPDQSREVNLRLEAELKELMAGFSVTVPLQITSDLPNY